MRPVSGVTSKVLPDGRLELDSLAAGKRCRCDRAGTAMWIALRQSEGKFEEAAKRLAAEWEVEAEVVQAAMESWAEDLRAAGFLTHGA